METAGFFVVAFETVVVIASLVTFSLLGRRVEAEVCGFVDWLVVFGDILAGLVAVLTVLFDNAASVLDPALCTVWNVVRRVVCVVISTVVLVGFFVDNFVVSLNELAKVCVLCVPEIVTDVVYKIIDMLKLLIINLDSVCAILDQYYLIFKKQHCLTS